jgi:hypothetical protein
MSRKGIELFSFSSAQFSSQSRVLYISRGQYRKPTADLSGKKPMRLQGGLSTQCTAVIVKNFMKGDFPWPHLFNLHIDELRSLIPHLIRSPNLFDLTVIVSYQVRYFTPLFKPSSTMHHTT